LNSNIINKSEPETIEPIIMCPKIEFEKHDISYEEINKHNLTNNSLIQVLDVLSPSYFIVNIKTLIFF
jgi:hypothetical protein